MASNWWDSESYISLIFAKKFCFGNLRKKIATNIYPAVFAHKTDQTRSDLLKSENHPRFGFSLKCWLNNKTNNKQERGDKKGHFLLLMTIWMGPFMVLFLLNNDLRLLTCVHWSSDWSEIISKSAHYRDYIKYYDLPPPSEPHTFRNVTVWLWMWSLFWFCYTQIQNVGSLFLQKYNQNAGYEPTLHCALTSLACKSFFHSVWM